MQSQPSTDHQLKEIDKHTRDAIIFGQSSLEKPNLGLGKLVQQF